MKLLLDLICFKKGRAPSLMCHLMAIISMILEKKHSNVEENWHFLDVSQYYFKPAFFYHCRSQFHQRFSYEILGAKISNSKHSFVIFGAKISYKKITRRMLVKLTPALVFEVWSLQGRSDVCEVWNLRRYCRRRRFVSSSKLLSGQKQHHLGPIRLVSG